MKKIALLALTCVMSVVMFAKTPVVIPEGLETETYGLTASILMNGETKTSDFYSQLEVGFAGDDIYIQGFSTDTPDFWVKGTKNAEGKYVVPANQYMGTWDVGGIGWFLYDYFLTAVDDQNQMIDAVFTVDVQNKTLVNNQTLVVNGDEDDLYPYYTLTDGAFHFIPEVVAMPANPSVVDFVTTGDYPWVAFNIPTVGTNGEELLMKRLSYQIWVEKEGELSALTLTKNLYDYLTEDMSVIPYSFSDMTDILRGGEKVYLFQGKELKTWNNIGVKCIYTGGGVTNETPIVWEDGTTTGIREIEKMGGVENENWYTLDGRRLSPVNSHLSTFKKGLYIVNGRKVVVK